MKRLTRRRCMAILGAAGLAPFLMGAVDDEGDALPNVFISPCGRPFRAKTGAPYPSIDWFSGANAAKDGKLTKAEFVADAAAFFRFLDMNGDGVLTPPEIYRYEHRVAPEIIGLRVRVSTFDRAAPRARLWLAQIDRPGEIDPGGDLPAAPAKPKAPDEASQGASPYGLFDEPEPVMAADLDFDGVIRRANFLKLADVHFQTLDASNRGYLAFDHLPLTPIQRQILKAAHRLPKGA